MLDTASLEGFNAPELTTPGSTIKFAQTTSNFHRPKTMSAYQSTVMTTATLRGKLVQLKQAMNEINREIDKNK